MYQTEVGRNARASGSQSSDFDPQEGYLAKVRAERKHIFTNTTSAAYTEDGAPDEEKRLQKKQLQIALQRDRKPKFHWENMSYTRSIEKFKEMQLQKELAQSESYSLASSHKGHLPSMKSFKGARATY